jgi:hypothetical protein
MNSRTKRAGGVRYAPEFPQRRRQRVAGNTTIPNPLPIHILLVQQRKIAPFQSHLFIPLLPHRMPSPNLRLRPPQYVAVEGRSLPLAEECQRACDGRTGVRGGGETADAAGCGEGGESGDDWGEGGGWGVGR